MPSQPIATWITPCSSRNEYPAGTTTRRQAIGLIVSSHTFNCRSALAPGIGDEQRVPAGVPSKSQGQITGPPPLSPCGTPTDLYALLPE